MKKDKNPRRTVRREAKRRRRLPPDARCVCGESAPEALELHHVAGRAHERNLTIPLCKNCHAKASEGQLREEIPLRAAESFPERVAAILAALAAFFRFLAESLDHLAGQVAAFVGALDAEVPAWRNTTERS